MTAPIPLPGNKIFITGGDHDLTENIIHPVLARIEGAPAGSKGNLTFSRSQDLGQSTTAVWEKPNDLSAPE